MKKVILASVLATVAVGAANAAVDVTACTSGTAAAVNSSATGFVKVQFTPKCSANTVVFGEDNGTYYRVGSYSVKGKNAFGGSTMGGGVSATLCAGTSCAASDATTALSAAASS
ncbi:MAG: hypothetical protein EG825_02465 [Rhodocyclaceae bacterium]|nr:hypothetical protein [Rhodocyclaceae bacterium]